MKFWTALIHALKILGASLLPLIAAVLAVWIDDQTIMGLKGITGKGEIIIICIPISVTIIFSLYDYKIHKKDVSWTTIVFYVTLIWSFLSIFIYARDFNEIIEPNWNLALYSIVFLGWTFIAMIFDKYNLVIYENVPKSRSEDADDLENKFNKINEQ